MAKQIKQVEPVKRGPGRPSKGGRGIQVQVRMTPEDVVWLDKWCERQGDNPTRSEALRRFMWVIRGRDRTF